MRQVERLALGDEGLPDERPVEGGLVAVGLERDGPLDPGLVGLVALSEVDEVPVGAADRRVQVALRVGTFGPGLLGELVVGADGVHERDAVPGEVGGGGAAGRGPALRVDDGEHGRGRPLHGHPVGPEAHDGADGLTGVPVDAVEQAELPGVEDDEAGRPLVQAGPGEHAERGQGQVGADEPLGLERPVQAAKGDRHQTIRAWTSAELGTFLTRTAHQRHHVAWHLLALTGMRRGEVLGLSWDVVDLDAGTVSVRRTLVDVLPGGDPVWSDPKTDRGRRLVNLDAGTIGKLRSHRAAQAQERLLVGTGYRDHALVFAMPDGRPIHPERFSREYAETVARSELPVIRLHDLRHTWATLALQAGVHPKVVQERLGHSNIAITLDIYSHVIPAMQSDAADRVAALVTGA